MQDTLAMLGVGGIAGTLMGIWFGGKRLAGRLESLRGEVEQAAKRPLETDLNALVWNIKLAEEEARSLWRMIQGVFK
jgi:hypothetical protein